MGQTRHTEPPEHWIARAAVTDWRALFPLRHQHAEQIRRVVSSLPRSLYPEVRVAFGLDAEAPPHLQGRLYRDLYVERPPAASTWDVALGAFRRGDPQPLRQRFAARDGTPADWIRAWYEITTLAGRIVVVPHLDDGVRPIAVPLDLEPPMAAVTARLMRPDELAVALTRELYTGFTLERHRTAAAATATAVSRGGTGPWLEAAMSLLLHHRDRAPGLLSGHGGFPGDATELGAVSAVLATPDAFATHIADGLFATSRPRRWLAFRLSAASGRIAAGSHPDDGIALS
ncbi:MAG: hypothetical protein K8W52_06655 [Deltaproteobacteria bacterium]|nr:hypothetical protein [Deltaproteobacteria bacterium]